MRNYLIFLVLPVLAPFSCAIAQDAEMNQTENWLRQMDTNKNGSIEKNEATGLMQRNFVRVDTNKDGRLARKELVALSKRLADRSRSQNNRNQRDNPLNDITDEQLQQRLPDGVKVEMNLVYREGHERWKLDLAMPIVDSPEPRPAIVFIHGGGWRNGNKRRGAFLGLALEYATKGYVTITVNYRLGGPKLDCIEDVKCAVRWLRAHAEKYNIDPDRIGAYGNSAGAHLVTMLGISYSEKKLEGDGPWQEYSSRIQAVTASATPTSPSMTADADYSESLIQPMSYITKDAPPFLLVHEESDKTVDVSNSDDFVKAMKSAGAKDINYMRYTDGTGHGVFGANKDETWPAMEKFFARVLGKK